MATRSFILLAFLLATLALSAGPLRAQSYPGAAEEPSGGRLAQAALLGSYAALYGTAFRLGTRRGLDGDFQIVRLESAYAYDLFAHVWAAREMGRLASTLHRRAGHANASAWGSWLGGFGALTTMEILNGFMPRVRLDPLDPVANALGAVLAHQGPRWLERWPELQRFNYQFGYRDWGRTFSGEEGAGPLGNIWHDYPNSQVAIGWGIGPRSAPWFDLLFLHGINSFELEELRNQYALGVELRPTNWLPPAARELAVLGPLLKAWDWMDTRLLMPGLVIELHSWESGPYSDRAPFTE